VPEERLLYGAGGLGAHQGGTGSHGLVVALARYMFSAFLCAHVAAFVITQRDRYETQCCSYLVSQSPPLPYSIDIIYKNTRSGTGRKIRT
jgi:hypothetical protein